MHPLEPRGISQETYWLTICTISTVAYILLLNHLSLAHICFYAAFIRLLMKQLLNWIPWERSLTRIAPWLCNFLGTTSLCGPQTCRFGSASMQCAILTLCPSHLWCASTCQLFFLTFVSCHVPFICWVVVFDNLCFLSCSFCLLGRFFFSCLPELLFCWVEHLFLFKEID